MILISHRGNINGPRRELENKPRYINQALELGYDVEIDVWWKEDEFWLGHDEPQFKVNRQFLQNDKLWCHAKNIDAFYYMVDDTKIHCFSHDKDEVALTTRGYFWSLSESDMTTKSISVLPSDYKELLKGIAGICSDNIGNYNE
jgi:hypothetical protein